METYEEIRALMEEPAGGDNTGRSKSPDRPGLVELSARAAQEREFLRTGGWGTYDVKHGREATGIVGHRGAVHPDEWVDRAELRRLVEERLGFGADDLRACYGGRGGGPLPC